MSDLTPREARMLFALLKTRKAQLDRALKHVAPFIEQEPGDKNMAKLGAAPLGRVAMTEPEVKPRVDDVKAFTEYVKETAGTEIETREMVRPAYEAKLLGDIAGRGAPVDGDGREVPGVSFGYASQPQQRFYAEENAEEMLRLVEPRDLPQIDGMDLAEILGVRPAIEAGEGA